MESCSHSYFAGSSRCLRQLAHRFAAPRSLVHTRCQAPPRGTEFGKESRIGKAPILIPKGVQLTLTRDLLKVKVRCHAPNAEEAFFLAFLLSWRNALRLHRFCPSSYQLPRHITVPLYFHIASEFAGVETPFLAAGT